MPVILLPGDDAAWVGNSQARDAADLIRPYPSEEMRVYRVSPVVNCAKIDRSKCVEPSEDSSEAIALAARLAPPPAGDHLFGPSSITG